MKRPRKVLGRRTVEIDGQAWRFEQRADGLWVRQKHKRRVVRLSFEFLANLSRRQMWLLP